MWQTKYASDVPKNLGLGLNFRPCSEFFSGRLYSVETVIYVVTREFRNYAVNQKLLGLKSDQNLHSRF